MRLLAGWRGRGPLLLLRLPGAREFRRAGVAPASAFYSEELSEFVLPYESVRTAADPDGVLLEFLQTGYEAAATASNWDRKALERPKGVINAGS